MEEDFVMLKRAEEILSTLASGINPFTGEVLEDDSLMSEPKMIRCLFYTRDVLKKLIASGGKIGRPKKTKLVWNEDFAKKVQPSSQNMPLSQFCKYILDSIGDMGVSVRYKDVVPWLLKAGLLEEVDGRKRATELGHIHGILNTKNVNRFGVYYEGVTYTPKAQQFLLDNMREILEESKSA